MGLPHPRTWMAAFLLLHMETISHCRGDILWHDLNSEHEESDTGNKTDGLTERRGLFIIILNYFHNL
jgi:hypothetical protein